MKIIINLYGWSKKNFWPIFLLYSYVSDFTRFVKFSGIRKDRGRRYKILMDLHRIEKGMSLPIPKRNFGKEPLQFLRNNVEYINEDRYLTDYTFSLLGRYREYLDDNGMLSIVDSVLEVLSEAYKKETTAGIVDIEFDQESNYLKKRKSVRNFKKHVVSSSTLKNVERLCNSAPSVCNRQPWTVSFYQDKKLIDRLLSLQNGNVGFRETIYNLAIISCDYRAFNIIGERNQIFVDGGMFSMNFVHALKVYGLDSCFLNWAVEPRRERKLHDLSKIEQSQRIIVMVAFGYAAENAKVAISPREEV